MYISGSASAGALQYDSSTQTYSYLEVPSYSVLDRTITLPLPGAGIYIFAAVNVDATYVMRCMQRERVRVWWWERERGKVVTEWHREYQHSLLSTASLPGLAVLVKLPATLKFPWAFLVVCHSLSLPLTKDSWLLFIAMILKTMVGATMTAAMTAERERRESAKERCHKDLWLPYSFLLWSRERRRLLWL